VGYFYKTYLHSISSFLWSEHQQKENNLKTMTREFISQQLDFIFFFYGFAFVLLAVVTLALNRIDKERLPWRWLIFFGLSHGLNEWLDMAAISLGDHRCFTLIRLLILAISFLFLLEFGRRSLEILKGVKISPILTAMLVIIASWGGIFGLPGLSVSIRYTLGLTGAFSTAYAFWLYRRRFYAQSKPLGIAAVAFSLYAIFAGLIVPAAPFFPAAWLNQELFSSITGFPVQLLLGILAIIIAFAIWNAYLDHRKALLVSFVHKEIKSGMVIAGMVILILLTGWLFTEFIGEKKEASLKESLLLRVQLAGAALDPAMLKKLKWNDSDLKSKDYQYLKSKMIQFQKAAPDSRFVCLMGYRNHRTYVLADSEPADSPDYSPPGQYYAEASPDYIRLLGSGKEDIIGPLNDRWGSWITGVFPMVSFDQQIIHLVFDFDAAYWVQEVKRARLIPIVLILMIALMFLPFSIMYQHSLDTREALAASEMTLRRVFDHVYDAIIVHDENGHIIDANDRMLSLYDITRHEIGDLSVVDDLSSPENEMDTLQKTWQKVLDGENYLFEWKARRPHDGIEFPVEVHLCRMDLSGKPVIVATVRDLTAHKRSESDRNTLHEQFLQAQKMESVGRLAGGVAHDFNNMLAAILGYAELTLEYMTPPGAPHRECLLEIQKAGERAKSLTRQLLAFGRKQVLEFKVTNMNQVIRDFKKLLKRLIGEDINIQTNLSPVLQSIMADVSQLEQILLNLAVNARDAMPKGGELIITTENIILSPDYIKNHADVKLGEYVLLSVTDTGVGMDEDIRRRIFEPFFTTKDKGKGTGLGLSTVYGIVTQHGGHIDVTSSVGQGTTFMIYFPTTLDMEEPDAISGTMILENPRRSLLVLVVEDDPSIRLLTCRFLDQLGHKVLDALDVRDAIRICSEHRNAIDVLLTDVVMPDMTGRQLYEHVREFSPAMHVIYMSGYPEQVIANHGVLKKGTYFLQKPFSSYDLSRILQEAIKTS
jgi:two-component system, cell cycle sensor histidine kinase and response regulator CckA